MKRNCLYFIPIFLILIGMTLIDGNSEAPEVLPVPLTAQSTTYSCGAASLQAVLAYYGHPLIETKVMEGVRTTTDGSEIENLTAFARTFLPNAYFRTNTSVAELEDSLKRKHPVIVEIQAWGKEPTDYKNDWSNGHYVVVIGIDSQQVTFMDPMLIGSRGVLPMNEFLDRWHEIGSDGEERFRTAVFFDGIPAAPEPRAPIK